MLEETEPVPLRDSVSPVTIFPNVFISEAVTEVVPLYVLEPERLITLLVTEIVPLERL